MTTMTDTTAKARFLAATGDPVIDILKPFAEGAAEWEATREGLIGLTYAEVPKATGDQLMGRSEDDYTADTAPGDDPVPGSWGQVLRARNYGILTTEQLHEVLEARAK